MNRPIRHEHVRRPPVFSLAAMVAGLVVVFTSLAVGLRPGLAGSDERSAPDAPEPGSIEAIAAATTEPRFLSPWVASVPFSPTVPSPT